MEKNSITLISIFNNLFLNVKLKSEADTSLSCEYAKLVNSKNVTKLIVFNNFLFVIILSPIFKLKK